jgi:pyridinium-3,5-biscarboxylic acid mononucleotide synthase
LSTSTNGIDDGEIFRILQLVKDGHLSVEHAQQRILSQKNLDSHDPLRAFANLDYRRSIRVGFPEVVFAQSKTPEQVAMILDSMAARQSKDNDGMITPILATRYDFVNTLVFSPNPSYDYYRVTASMFREMGDYVFQSGSISYYSQAGIVAIRPEGCNPARTNPSRKRIVVVTAGTTDIPVAEEAAVTLELSGFSVDRVFDAGVAGLHRILIALPQLTRPDVGCAIVVAGMDGALPSVVGGLVKCPVIAVPTSIGYGASFGGISALLTMLNSCSPGVGVVNIDNGFGAAALAFKCLSQNTDA